MEKKKDEHYGSITEINGHRVRNGNVLDDGAIEAVIQNEKADIMYSDPPWGQGNLNYWQTMNLKMNPDLDVQRKEVPYDDFLNKIFDISARYSNGVVFIEYGVQWEQDILDKAQKYGLKHNATIVTQYLSGSKKLPLHLHIFNSPIELQPEYLESVKGTHGYATLQAAIKPFVKKGGIVLDPCCGMGYSAQIAIDNGMKFRGNELNWKRLSNVNNISR